MERDINWIIKQCKLGAIILLASIMQLNGQNKYGGVIIGDSDSLMSVFESNFQELKFSSNQKSALIDLPAYVDNSKLKFFPPIFNQISNSCSMASGIGYTYNYEMNCLLDRDGKSKRNRCNYMHIYNYLNHGEETGSFVSDGWKLISDNGCAMYSDYSTYSTTEWPGGYNVYIKGFCNDVARNSYIKCNNHEETIIRIKRYLFDRGDGSEYGGLLNFSALAHNLSYIPYYSGPSLTGYNRIVESYSTDGPHSMTIVGYDDTVEHADGKGAFICANTWGAGFGDEGFFYMPYTLAGKGTNYGGTDIYFYIVKPKIRTPKIIFKVYMQHSSRNDFYIDLGVATDRNATEPGKVITKRVMCQQGGDYELSGTGSKSLKFALDASDLASYIDQHLKENRNPTYFLVLKCETIGERGTGKILEFEVEDYRNSSEATIFKCKDLKSEFLSGSKLLAKRYYYEYSNGDELAFNIEKTEQKNYQISLDLIEDRYLKIDLLNNEDIAVKNLIQEKMTSGEHSINLDCSSFNPGNYRIKITTYDQVIYRNIVI